VINLSIWNAKVIEMFPEEENNPFIFSMDFMDISYKSSKRINRI